MSKRQERRAQFKALGRALTSVEEQWADRRGELVAQEYRGVKSADETRCGPKTLQIVKLYDRRQGQLRPETPEQQEERVRAAEFRWNLIKQLHGIANGAD